MTDARKPLLIVEDDPALQKQMQWAFEQYDAVVASDRETAVAQLRRASAAIPCRTVRFTRSMNAVFSRPEKPNPCKVT